MMKRESIVSSMPHRNKGRSSRLRGAPAPLSSASFLREYTEGKGRHPRTISHQLLGCIVLLTCRTEEEGTLAGCRQAQLHLSGTCVHGALPLSHAEVTIQLHFRVYPEPGSIFLFSMSQILCFTF